MTKNGLPYQKTASVFVPHKGIPQNRLKSSIAQRHRLVSYITVQRKNRYSRYLARDCMQVHAISSIFRQISKPQSKSVPDMANPSYWPSTPPPCSLTVISFTSQITAFGWLKTFRRSLLPSCEFSLSFFINPDNWGVNRYEEIFDSNFDGFDCTGCWLWQNEVWLSDTLVRIMYIMLNYIDWFKFPNILSTVLSISLRTHHRAF